MKTYFYKDHLESDRLKTRMLEYEDYRLWTKFFEDDKSVAFFPNPLNENPEERAIRWMNKCLTRYKEKTSGLQAILNKETGEFLGQCGLITQVVDGMTELEVGYHMFRQNWGKGYAPEAAKMFMQFGFENDLADSIISIIHVDNLRSQRVAEKNGLKREKTTYWNDHDVVIYRIHKNEFFNNR